MPYHVTLADNLPRIMKQGLVPQKGPRASLIGEDEDGIYLFKTIDDAEDALYQWLGEEFDEDEKLSLLQVDVPPGARTQPTRADYELVVLDPIPPQYIRIVYKDIDETVNL